MSPERIPFEGWRSWKGHVDRYEWAAREVRRGEVVLDAPCGIGYGAELLAPTGCEYLGVDVPGAVADAFRDFGDFLEMDLDLWDGPADGFDVGLCFEGLEHVLYPNHLAWIMAKARRLVLVSVPTIPTVGINPYHRHDFTVDDVPALFPSMELREVIPQPSESSHLYAFTRRTDGE